MTPEEESEEDRLRAELVIQLMESLAKSRSMILNEKMDVRTRERWTELHTRTALTRTGFRAAVVAPSLRQSRKLIDKIDRLVSILKIDVLEGLPRKGRLVFRNGSVIEALPNNPDTIRGETLNMVVADEFAYIEHDDELYDAIIFTLSTTNGPFFATSTPGSRDTLFYEMATDDQSFGDFSRHHVGYREALKPNGPIDPEFLERIKKQYRADPGRWRREMEAEFADDEDAYLPRDLIESCVSEILKRSAERTWSTVDSQGLASSSRAQTSVSRSIAQLSE